MPETYFTIELPDGERKECYSPSTVVKKYFGSGDEMAASEFLARSRVALREASERVRAKYGFECTSAMGQLREIEGWMKDCSNEGIVKVVAI